MSAFEQAAQRVLRLAKPAANHEKLALYGLYKQATVGSVSGPQPWAVQIEARAKYDAWASRKHMNKDQAKEAYIVLVNELIKKYGTR